MGWMFFCHPANCINTLVPEGNTEHLPHPVAWPQPFLICCLMQCQYQYKFWTDVHYLFDISVFY